MEEIFVRETYQIEQTLDGLGVGLYLTVPVNVLYVEVFVDKRLRNQKRPMAFQRFAFRAHDCNPMFVRPFL